MFWLRNLAHCCGFIGFKPVYIKNTTLLGTTHSNDGKSDEITEDNLKLCQVYCDNQPTINRCMKPGRWASKRKVHINYTKSVEYCNPDSALQICKLAHVKSQENQADIFTKIGVNVQDWLILRMRIMNLPSKHGR